MLSRRLLTISFLTFAALAGAGCGAQKPPPSPARNSPSDNIQRINSDQSLTPEQRQAALQDAQRRTGGPNAAK